MRLLYFMALMLMVSCKPLEKMLQERYEKIETETVYRDRLLPVPTAKTDTVIRWKELPVGRPVYVTDPTTQARLSLMRDSLDRLVAECRSRPDSILVRDTFIDRRTVIKDKLVQEERSNRWGWAEWLLVGMALSVGLYAAYRIFGNPYRK